MNFSWRIFEKQNPLLCVSAMLLAGWQIQFTSKQNAKYISLFCLRKMRRYLIGLSKTRLFLFFSATLSSRSSPPPSHPVIHGRCCPNIIPVPRQRKRHFSSPCTAFTLPCRNGRRHVEAGLYLKTGAKCLGGLNLFKLNGWHPGGGLSKMIKKVGRRRVCELSRRVDTGWPDLHPEPGSLLAFQRKATCLAPSADLNTVCPKNLAAQHPNPLPQANLSVSLSPSLQLILHAQTTTTTTKKRCVSSLRLAQVRNVSAFTSSLSCSLTRGIGRGLVYMTC